MSREIDERIVEMRFDNRQFESGVQTSLSTLERLKKGLDLNGAAKGLDQLGTAAQKCDMSMLGRSVETVQAKFSAFEVVAMSALSNITNSAVNAGKRLLSSLTIEPISTGFSEYELKMDSIQTIMASTGESLDVVNQKLDELNKYSDRTIYSFSDMTSNIGKFTNAGVKLNDAVAAIQGVSNVAAVSGANANEASRAMYNFAQALSAGYVKLIDWKSIENANMATVEFKTQLLESAVAAGTLTKTTDGMYKTLAKGTVIDATHMFNDSLQEQWMTTEVLTSTLKDYADETTEIGKKAFAAAQDVKTWSQLLDTLKESAQSGWAETWQLVAGDYEEAKTTLRTFSEFFSSIIDGSADARNSLLQGALMSSWGQLKDRVSETGVSVDAFRDALRETAESSVDGLDKMIEEAGSFDATLSQGWLTTDILAETMDNLVGKAAGTEAGISDLSDEQLRNIGYTQEQINALRALSDEAKSSSGDIASLVAAMTRQSGRELLFDSLLNGAKAVQGLFTTIKGAWQEVFPPATSEQLYSFIEALHSASERIRDFFTQAEASADGFTTAVNGPLENIKNTFKGLFAILDIVGQAFSALWRAISPASSAVGGLLTGVLGLAGSFGECLVKLDETIKKNDLFYKGIKGLVDFIKGAVTAVASFGSAIGESLGFPGLEGAKASFQEFLNILKAKISMPGMEFLHSLFNGICTRAKQVRDAIVGMKDGIVDSMGKVDSAVSKNKFVQVLSGIGTLVKQAASAISGLLGKALDGLVNTIRNADFNGLLDFLNVLAAGGLAASLKKFFDPMDEMKDSVQSLFDWAKDWVKGMGNGLTSILDGVRGSLEAWQTKLKSDALGKIAASIAVLSVSLLVLASIDSDKVTGSLAAMATMLGELIASMAVLEKLSIDGKAVNKIASAMIKIGASLLVLSLALKNIGELEPEQVAEGLIAVGVLLAEIDVFLGTAKFDKNASKTATGMILFAAAIKILASSVQSLGSMDWDDMAKGLAGVGVLLAEVDVFLNTAKFSGKAVLTATGMVILASAIKVLASACQDFGSMSVGEITKGLSSIAAILLEITAFTKLTGDAKHVISTGLALIEIAAAMKIFASAMDDFGSMSGSEIAKGLIAMGGALAEVAIAVNLMPKNMIGIGTGLIIVGTALKLVASVLSSMGNMSWEGIAKGLVTMGGALAELAIGLNVMNGTLAGSAAMLVAAGALNVLTPVLVILSTMTWEGIAKGLIAIAGAFTVFGVAGYLLTPVVPTIVAISGALSLLVGSLAAFMAAVAASNLSMAVMRLTAPFQALADLAGPEILKAYVALIPEFLVGILKSIGDILVAICNVIIEGAPAIGEAIKAVILTLVDVLVECIPVIADGALQLVTGVLTSLVSYTPQIIDSVMQFLIEVLEGIARNMPQLIQAAMDVVGAFFSGILSALSNIDSASLIQGIAAVGLLAALVAALGAISGLVPQAMVGVLGMGVVITELAVVLAAIGALAQIPGLEWLVGEGGQLLKTIGTAIGGFVGGIAGGFMSGVSSSFPQIGTDLSSFMTNVQPFIDGASSISPDMLSGVKALTEAIVLITAADLLESLTSWLTGSSSLTDFAEQLVPFGEAMMEFSNTISGLDGDLVNTAAIAGKTLAEMAATLPNTGGIVGFFAGENDMDVFGKQLVGFGESMMSFSNSIKGMDADAVQNAAIAGKTLAEMAATLPNTGGVVGFFAGENDMDTFGEQLVGFGESMMAFSESIKGLDTDAVQNAIIAGKAMAEMAATLPNTGGAVTFFTGNNDMDTFGEQLVAFGEAIKEYSDAVTGLDADVVINSATASRALTELANTVLNTGGAIAFFTGDNDLGTFGEQIVAFGNAMKEYSQSISGLDVSAVTNSAVAGAALVELANTIPNMGGLVSFFAGSNDLETFADQLAPFGKGMKAYSDAIVGLDAEAITASAVAAQSLAQLQSSLPNVGSVMEFFTGGNDLGKFAEGLAPFGKAMKSYSDSVVGVNADSVTASAIAAKSLAELQLILPNIGGVMTFFTGGNDLKSFAAGIIPFGAAMKSYGEAVAEINSDAITASAVAAQSLAQLQTTLPSVGGVMEFFTGTNDLATFAAGIVPFGKAMKSYGDSVADINADSITASAIAAQSLAELQNTLPQIGGVMEFFTGGYDLAAFGAMLIPFGKAMSSYGAAVSGISAEAVTNSATAGMALVELAKTLPKCGGLVDVFSGSSSLAGFGNEIIQFGKDLSAYANAIKDVKPEVVTASANAAQALSNLATGLPDSSLFDKWFGGDQTLSSFGKDISAFGADMSNYYSQVAGIDLTKLSGVVTQVWSLVDLAKGVQGLDTSGFSSFGNSLKSLANTGITEFTSAFSNSTAEITKSVRTMLNSVSTSISDNKTLTTPGMEYVMKALAEVVAKKATEINASVTAMMKGIATTIHNSSPSLQAAIRTVLSNVVSAINSMKGEFNTAGQNAGQGFVNGINAKMSSATTAGRNLGLAALNAAKKALDSHSPSREFIHLGENMGEGLAIGAKNSIVPAAQATSKMIDEVLKVSSKGIEAFQEWAEEKKYYGELSLKDELAGYENLQQKYKAGSEERIKIDREVYRIQNELVAATYQASIDWIEEKKFYNELSTQEELEAYERMQARYLEGSEERKKIDREVYTLRNQLMDESYQRSMDWIEEEKYYNRLSLADELAAYKRVQSRYAQGTEERKKMDREVYRLEKEICDAQKQYIADVQSAQEKANQKRVDLEEEYASKVKSINEKLASDIQSLNDKYLSSLESRTDSLYKSYGLFDEVKEREEVSGETLMKNLQDQVNEFGAWQDTLGELSVKGVDSALIEELQEMGPSAVAQIKALNSMSDSELEKYVALWSIKHAMAREQAVGELEGLRIETQNSIAQLRVDADRELEEYRATWQEKMNQVTIDTNAELEQLRKDFGEKVGLIKKDTESEMQEMADTAQAILQEAGWDETGKQIVTGITTGVEAEKPNFLDALTQMALDGVAAVKDTLDINSPSRVFRELGNFTGLGFVKGLDDYANKSYDAGANMADYATDGLSNAISAVSDLVNGEFDMQPTIRPVLDFSNVSRGVGELNGLFSNTRAFALAGQTSLAFNSTIDKGDMSITVDNDGVVQELRSLRSDMAEMTEQIKRMQVVLDTGTLVGEMADPMDAALGRKMSYRGRGI